MVFRLMAGLQDIQWWLFLVESENIAIHIFRSNLNMLGENLAKQFTPATLYYQPQYLLMRKQLYSVVNLPK